MSRNLCTSSCINCGYTVRLSDIRDKPIEFRKYGPYTPQIGCKFICNCGEVYFAIWRVQDTFWDQESLDDGSWKSEHQYKYKETGRFAREISNHNGEPVVEQTGCFTIDLSHYATYNDEKISNSDLEQQIHSGLAKPWHICEDDALDSQWEW